MSGDHEHGHHDHPTSRDIIHGFFSNWREFDGPFGRKVALTLRNRAKAFVTLKGCCGNHGEPGC